MSPRGRTKVKAPVVMTAQDISFSLPGSATPHARCPEPYTLRYTSVQRLWREPRCLLCPWRHSESPNVMVSRAGLSGLNVLVVAEAHDLRVVFEGVFARAG